MLENRKALTICIGYVLGIIMGLYCKISIVLFYFILYLIYLIYGRNQNNKKFKLFSIRRYFRYIKVIFNKESIKIIIIFSIISNSIVLFQNYKYDNLYKELNNQICKFKGIVISSKKDKLKVRITNQKYRNTYLYISNKNNVEVGDEIVFSGKFSLPKKRTNYKGYDAYDYYKRLKIYGLVKVNKIEIISKDKCQNTYKISSIIKSNIQETKMTADEKAILEGIILGDKTDITEETLDLFSSSNISYILAVSGMHISYIILSVNFIFNKLIGKHYSKVITSIMICIYMCIVNFTSSIVRAGICGIIGVMSNFVYRREDKWESLSLALLVILFYNPFLIQDLGLELSFAGILGILIFRKTFSKWVNDFLDRKNRKAIRRNKRFQKIVIKMLNTQMGKVCIDATIVTLSATLTVSPLVLINFNKLSITSLIISVLISFLIGPIVILGFICVFFRLKILELMLQFLIKILIGIANLGSKMPLNQIVLPTPSIFSIFIYYFVILIINLFINISLETNPNCFQKRIKNLFSVLRYKCKLCKRRIIAVILIICILYQFWGGIPKNLRIYFIDVGQGDSTLVITPSNKSILIDGGGSEFYNIRKKNSNAIFIR